MRQFADLSFFSRWKARRAARILTRQTANAGDSNRPIDLALAQQLRRDLAPFDTVSPVAGHVVVIEGHVTMAIDLRGAVQIGHCRAVPGVDHRRMSGWLIFGAGAFPFHSLQDAPGEAVVDALACNERSRRMDAYFGDRGALKRAVRYANWMTFVRLTDAAQAGLCAWGTESFFRTFGIWWLIRRLGGVPKFVVWAGGRYPRRAVAAAIMRQERQIRRQANMRRITNG